MFSESVPGNGCSLISSSEQVYAPNSGTVSRAAETRHAIDTTKDEVVMLLHMGLKTAGMNGKGFDVKVKEGDTVKAGQLLMAFSLSKIAKAEIVKSTSSIPGNDSDEFPGFTVLRTGAGKAGERLFMLH